MSGFLLPYSFLVGRDGQLGPDAVASTHGETDPQAQRSQPGVGPLYADSWYEYAGEGVLVPQLGAASCGQAELSESRSPAKPGGVSAQFLPRGGARKPHHGLGPATQLKPVVRLDRMQEPQPESDRTAPEFSSDEAKPKATLQAPPGAQAGTTTEASPDPKVVLAVSGARPPGRLPVELLACVLDLAGEGDIRVFPDRLLEPESAVQCAVRLITPRRLDSTQEKRRPGQLGTRLLLLVENQGEAGLVPAGLVVRRQDQGDGCPRLVLGAVVRLIERGVRVLRERPVDLCEICGPITLVDKDEPRRSRRDGQGGYPVPTEDINGLGRHRGLREQHRGYQRD